MGVGSLEINWINILVLLLCVSIYFILDKKRKLEDLELRLQQCRFESNEKLADINSKIISNLFENVAFEIQSRDLDKFKMKVNDLHKRGEVILSEIYPNGYCPAWDGNKFVKDFFSWNDSHFLGNISRKYIKITPEQLKGYSDDELDSLIENLFFIITVKSNSNDLNLGLFFHNTYVIGNRF